MFGVYVDHLFLEYKVKMAAALQHADSARTIGVGADGDHDGYYYL